ncbi:alpha/beta hydrolase [Planctomonas psychrotolerans]|uniref:alpha/beta hydrolase n=1 Tax=Planctomonas psychrotolerans TaxID=2528712 RepID=UPI00123C5998|nr:alpha/beta hydrolase [Planctomonas psychrotolerans]
MKHRMLILAAALATTTIALVHTATPVAVESAVAESPTVGILSWLGSPDVTVVPDLVYGTAPDGTPLTADVCLPAASATGGEAPHDDAVGDADGAAALRPAVIEVHGGGWSRGDKAEPEWRLTCQWLASEGFVVVNVNYRLAPQFPFPAAIDDVTAAVRWLRSPAVAERFAVDPERIGAFGGSAGGNLAALLGTRGSGDVTSGERVAAVVAVSAPFDLTAHGQTLGAYPGWLTDRELSYLGCAAFDGCAAAIDASPVSFVDRTDPPMLVAQSADEFIPLAQAESFAAALATAGVDHTLEVDAGIEHSTAALDESLRARVADFLRDALR